MAAINRKWLDIWKGKTKQHFQRAKRINTTRFRYDIYAGNIREFKMTMINLLKDLIDKNRQYAR